VVVSEMKRGDTDRRGVLFRTGLFWVRR